jgi:DNA polymerase-3 subunit alpha
VGEGALDAVLEARTEGGSFRDLFDLSQRVDARKLNKGMLEALVQAGALDSTAAGSGVSRAQIFAAIDRALERSRTATRDREAGQTTLFAMLDARKDNAAPLAEGYFETEPWDLRDTLQREKQALGFYVSGHPLDRYGHELSRFDVVRVLDLANQDQWAKVRVAGTVEGYRERTFRSGGKVAFFQLEDLSGGVTVKVREKLIERHAELLTGGEPILVTGKVTYPQQAEDAAEDFDSGPKEPSVLLDEAVPLAEAIRAETRSVAIRLREASTRPEQIDELSRVLRASPGSCPVQLIIETDEGAEAVLALGRELSVEPSDAMLASLERLFGTKVAELR